MPTVSADLPTLFGRVARTLKANQDALNEADSFNHDHGTNMVKNFQVITKAVKEKKDEPPAVQLAHASRVLAQKAKSGSARLYADGLSQAARQMEGQRSITADNAMSLIQALLGGGSGGNEGAAGDFSGWGADKAPSIRQPQGGAEQARPSPVTPAAPQRQPSQGGGSAGGDPMAELMSTLLSGAAGGQAASQPESRQPQEGAGGIDLNTLLTAGMAYMQANQQGASPLEALAQAVVAGSQMGSSSHHTQSGQLVAGTLLSAIGKLFGGKKR